MMSVGICLVSRQDWPEYCRISTDIPVGSDYDTYLKGVEELCDSMAAKGRRPVKLDVKPAELLAWCQERGLEVNSSSRSHYAAARIAGLNQK